MPKYTLIRWLNGVAVEAVVLPLPEALNRKKLWRRKAGNLAFMPYRPDHDQIVAVANQALLPEAA